MKYEIVDYKREYAPALSNIITRNLLEINSNDYPLEEMRKLALDFTAEKIDQFSKIRKIFVAIKGDTPIGVSCAAKDIYGDDYDYVILTVFILPELQGKGIGAKLIKKCEEYIRSVNGRKISIPSSITSHKFYNKLGYDYLNSDMSPNKKGHIMMVKTML